MAIIIVIIELLLFQIIYFATKNYYSGTVVSFVFAVALNWIGGRKFIFGSSHHTQVKEFIMVLVGSTIGLLIQLFVVFIFVGLLVLYPLIGKVLSIAFSFFWNYWFRSVIVYKN